MTKQYSLAFAVARHSLACPASPAISAEGKILSYGQVADSAARLAACLQRSSAWEGRDGVPPRVGILASRSIDACLGILGAAWAGATYIPLGTRLPEERLLTILSLCNLSAIVADAEGAKLLSERVIAAGPPLIVAPGGLPGAHCAASGVAVFDLNDLPAARVNEPVALKPTDPAYIIFTSGTTGVPKGVLISAGAIRHYIEITCELLGLTAEDRAVETLEVTFDVSLHDMFTTWEVGAALYILPATRVMNAVKFVRENALSVWFSVPSLVGMLKQVKALSPDAMPSLRVSVFGGEPLPDSVVAAWRAAAPNSRIENFYGPTEATVFCLRRAVTAVAKLSPERDFWSIGRPMPGSEAAVVDQALNFLAPGSTGELALAGVQLADGYLDAPELTSRRFPEIAGQRWYLTGDLAIQDADGEFHCLGRIDNQIKLHGYRIELEEIDTHLRQVSGNAMAATVAWPIADGIPQGLVAFVGDRSVDAGAIIARPNAVLPAYMIPGRVLGLDSLPLNSSGKIDRKALCQLLDQFKA